MVVGFLVFFPESMCKTTDLLVQGWERGAALRLDLECNSHVLQCFNIAERSDPYSETDRARDLERKSASAQSSSTYHPLRLCGTLSCPVDKSSSDKPGPVS